MKIIIIFIRIMFSIIRLEEVEYDVESLRHQFTDSFSDPYEIYDNLFPLLKIVNAYSYVDYKVKKTPKHLFNDRLMKSILDNFIFILKKNKNDKQVRDLSILLDIDIFLKYGYFTLNTTKITDSIHILNNYLVVKNVGLYEIKFDTKNIKSIKDVFEITNYDVPKFYCISDMLFHENNKYLVL